MIPPPEIRVQLSERDALNSAASNTRGFEYEIEARELRVPGQPCLGAGVDPPHLLGVDHLERIPIAITALLLHLDHEQLAPAAQHEIELVATDPRVGVQEPIAAKAIVAESATFAAIHAASMAEAS
jgi:hypothetical protein